MNDKKNLIINGYTVNVCRKSRQDSSFVTIAWFSENEKEKVNALVDLLRERSALDADDVSVTHKQFKLFPLVVGSPDYISSNDYQAKRNAAFDAKKLLVKKPVEEKKTELFDKRTKKASMVKTKAPTVLTADGRKREWKAVGKNAVLFVDGVESGYSEPFGSHRAAVEGAERLQEEDAE